MKYVIIEYADAVAISALALGIIVDVTPSGGSPVTSGKVSGVVLMIEPELVQHTHAIPGSTGTVSIPASATGFPG